MTEDENRLINELLDMLRLAFAMRKLQTQYFALRETSVLVAAKQAERAFDDAVMAFDLAACLKRLPGNAA